MLNPRILAVFLIAGVGLFIMFGGGLVFPTKYLGEKSVNVTPTPTPQIITQYITVTVTPTPDGHTYFANEYQEGIRKLKRPYTFSKENVTGNKDMHVTTIVYDYMEFYKLHWFNPAEYKYIEQLPSVGGKYLFVFVTCFMDDIIGDDTRMWAFNQSLFAAYVKGDNVLYRPVEYAYQVRFKELEEVNNFNNDVKVQAFKSFRAYSSNLDYKSSAGEYNDELYYLRGGRSNAIDGYIVFEIPDYIQAEDITILGNFYHLGSASWRLKI